MSTVFVSDLTLDESLVSSHNQAEESSMEGSPSLGDENVSPCPPSFSLLSVVDSLSSPESLRQQSSTDLPLAQPPKVRLREYCYSGK